MANPSGGIALMLPASESFGPVVVGGLAAAGIEEGSADFAQCLFAAQTVLDTWDPANTASFAVANGVPTLLLQNANDVTIPNAVVGAPISGTTPLGRFLGLTNVVASEPGFVAGERLFSRFNSGGHASVVLPTEDPAVTVEMQTQIVSFLSSPRDNKGVMVANPTVLLQ